MTTRPTADRVKEALFSIIQFDVPASRVLDLFGGTGQLGIEALSRDAKYAVFVDEQESACKLIRENLKRTKLEDCAKVVRSDYMSFLKNCKETFDIIFLDPPYDTNLAAEALPLCAGIAAPAGVIICETEKRTQLPETVGEFVRTKEYTFGIAKFSVYRRAEKE